MSVFIAQVLTAFPFTAFLFTAFLFTGYEKDAHIWRLLCLRHNVESELQEKMSGSMYTAVLLMTCTHG